MHNLPIYIYINNITIFKCNIVVKMSITQMTYIDISMIKKFVVQMKCYTVFVLKNEVKR